MFNQLTNADLIFTINLSNTMAPLIIWLATATSRVFPATGKTSFARETKEVAIAKAGKAVAMIFFPFLDKENLNFTIHMYMMV